MKINSVLKLILYSVILCPIASCTSKDENSDEIEFKSQSKPSKVEVPSISTIVVTKKQFDSELLTNGKIEAQNKTNLKFNKEGVVARIFFDEGAIVRKGDLIATLQNTEELKQLKVATVKFQRAQLEYEDQLLRSGYRLSDTAKLSASIKKIAKLRSGLANSELDLEQAQFDLALTKLYAPFTGMLANIQVKAYSQISSSGYVCTLIDYSKSIVAFQIIEQELNFIRTKTNVKIEPFTNGNIYNGLIMSINPIIDKAGMIQVKAILNHSNGLLDGMSVKVSLLKSTPSEIVVPKEAVLDRQSKKVVFTLLDSVAQWNYVELGGENSTQYAIKKGLKSGDRVIYRGNFNLSHNQSLKHN